jgi:F-type H+-transporting ATPase subunit c
MSTETARLLGAAIAILALYGVGISMGNLFSTWISSVARNPEARDKVNTTGMIGAALTESVALFVLIVAIMILYKA